MKHTQTPWALAPYRTKNLIAEPANGYGIYGADKSYIGDVHGGPSKDETGTRRANAEFIVRAVNAHDELVKAVEYIFASGQPLLTATAIRKLQKSLAKARGES